MKIMHPIIGALLAIATLISSCSKTTPIPVPKNKMNYIGTWSGNGVRLKISSDGTVDYTDRRNSKKISLNGPIVDFSGNDFEIKTWNAAMEFDVSKAPYQDKADIKMHINGAILKKVGR